MVISSRRPESMRYAIWRNLRNFEVVQPAMESTIDARKRATFAIASRSGCAARP